MIKLSKQLGALDVFAIAAGAMISSGLFVLPALAFAKTGPAVILSYLLASIMIIPSVLSKAELSTAMPRAGGTYFFVERSLGPIWGVFSGLASWFSLALKSAFAVVGMAVLIEIVLQMIFSIELGSWHLKAIAAFCCVGFTVLNVVSVKHTSRFQVLLVGILLVILPFFVAAHVILFNEAWGISWPMLPDGLADAMTIVVITACVFFVLRRLIIRDTRYITTPTDYVMVAIAAAPFITGILADQQFYNYRFWIILHILSGEIMLMAIPFTRLAHMLYALLTRAYLGSEFGGVRHARDW